MFAVPYSTATKLNRYLLSSSSSCCRTAAIAFFSSTEIPPEPTIDVSAFQTTLTNLAPSISKSLTTNGYYATPEPYSILPEHSIQTMREQSIHLRNIGRFEQSWSEKIDASGKVSRFDKEGVFACEPDGQDYHDAPDLILYLSVMLQTLPDLLNSQQEGAEFGLSASSFNAKLAVTSPGGSVYPLHIDNPQGLSAGDTRRLTCILYMNPDYQDGVDGGELRIFCGSGGSSSTTTSNSDNGNSDDEAKKKKDDVVDITPDGGRMVLFWSDEIPHEVLPTAPTADKLDEMRDRYALTVWIPTDYYHTIHNPDSKFANLGDEAFTK
ncbi:2OG-Fe(II) oxygenase [Skeletonema marinoi]|uniref:2OG-Fe(II) oxygenase n=1 Tax=Skeletonema marinoi TaxID=267567 RepID=A0AAD8YC67_9STRA|nr:2OG-Fe(II) oxygenase [Skeletonema marinoi]